MGSFKKFTRWDNEEFKMQVRPINTDKRELRHDNGRHIIEIKTQHDKFTLRKIEVKQLIEYLLRML